jgi:transposase
MAHGSELRIRVIKAVVEDGLSRNEAARVFRVGIATAIRWVEAYEASGRTEPLPMGANRPSPLWPHRAWLVALRRREKDLTLDDIADRIMAEHGVKTEKSALSRFFAAEAISFKKNSARQRAGTPRRRAGA